MQDELCRTDSSSLVSLASPSFSLLVKSSSSSPSPLRTFHTRSTGTHQCKACHGLACASSCCTPSCAATRNQLQQHLRCRKLVHPVNGQHTCGVWCPSMATGVRDIWLGLQGSPPDGGLVDGTHRVIPQSISTWGKLASSARPCAEQAVAQFKKLVFPYSAHTNASHSQGSKNLLCASRRIVSGAIFLVAFSFILVAIVRQDSKV